MYDLQGNFIAEHEPSIVPIVELKCSATLPFCLSSEAFNRTYSGIEILEQQIQGLKGDTFNRTYSGIEIRFFR